MGRTHDDDDDGIKTVKFREKSAKSLNIIIIIIIIIIIALFILAELRSSGLLFHRLGRPH